MQDKSRKDYALYRLEKAKSDLISAKINFNANQYNTAANRAYYSVFHTMRSVLALDEVEFSKHSSVLGYFNKEYLATNVIDRKYSTIIREASNARNAGDYDDFHETEQDEAEELIEKAEQFHEEISQYVHQRLENLLSETLNHEHEEQDEGMKFN